VLVELQLPASPDVCFAAFCDLGSARLWVPGLKKVRVVRSDARGRALEATYEFSDSLTYSLVYAYDEANRLVRWVPSAGAMDAVSGYARFEPSEVGCRLQYSLDSVRGRAADHQAKVAEAFAHFIAAGRA